MLIKKILLKLVLLIYFPLLVSAQNEGNIWYFGINAGMDFNSGSPVALTNGALNTIEGCASICDANGNLLFYTDGISVWNSNHLVMPNGNGLMGNSSSTQSAVITKKPGSTNIYFIFTVDDVAGPNGMRYSEVDISLQAGLGDINANKNIQIVNTTCEKIAVVKHQNGIDFWIVTHLFNSDAFHCYLLTFAGLSMIPVVTNIGVNISGTASNTLGYLKASLDGSRIAIANRAMNNAELFDFDNVTGLLSNVISFTGFNFPGAYGVEFSPSGNLLYISESSSGISNVYQYNLLAGSPLNISNSRITVGSHSGWGGAVQLGPDKKMYHARYSESNLGVINFPDSLGIGCNYVGNGFNLAGRSSQSGLPTLHNSFISIINTFSFGNLCFGDSTSFNIVSSGVIDSVFWNFGDVNSGVNNFSIVNEPKHVFSDTISYIITLIVYTGGNTYTLIDTLNINSLPSVALGNDTTFCQGDTILLDATYPNASYLWQNNSTVPLLTTSQAGIYWVDVTANNCTVRDSIVISIASIPFVNLGRDTVLCQGINLLLNASFPGATYSWINGNTNPILNVTQAGLYWVDVSNGNCIFRDSINISYNPLVPFSFGNDTILCDGAILILDALVPNASYFWQDSSNNAVFNVSQPGTYWVNVTLNNCSESDSIDVIYNPSPIVDLGNDTTLCQGDVLILDATNMNATYFWQDSSVNSTLIANEQGVYSVEVLMDGCISTDDITIVFESVPVVNLGNDTILCYGELLYLNAYFNNSTYTWNVSNINADIIIYSAGNYWVEVTNMCGSYIDSIEVDYNDDCKCYIYVPNAFSPNGDGKNDFISPKSNCGYIEYSFQLFNRWGDKVYESSSSREAWDGTVEGGVSPQGVYVYFLTYQFAEEKRMMKKGSATLIR